MAKEKETKKNVHEVVIKIEGDEWTKALDKVFAKKQKTAGKMILDKKTATFVAVFLVGTIGLEPMTPCL